MNFKRRYISINIIFLDIDGVLNCKRTIMNKCKKFKETGIYDVEIDEEMVKRLSRIVKETGAKIVLSSSWRNGWNTEGFKPRYKHSKMADDVLHKYGLEIFSITGRDKDGIRQNEIHEWLNYHNEVESFVVIDDEDFDLKKFRNKRLVKTSFKTGLQDRHVRKAIEILKGDNK